MKPKLKQMTPILRSFDESKAKEFYVDFLEFNVDFEHRFGPTYPLYMSVSRDGCTLHLSEHYGDATPGSSVRIETNNVDELSSMLRAKDYTYAKPGPPVAQPWGNAELTLTDPFGNKLVFWSPLPQQT